jgi:hypothetical protein
MPESVQICDLYAILRPFVHDSPESDHNFGEHRPLVLKLVHSWNVAAGAGSLESREMLVASPSLALSDEDEEQILDYDDPVAIMLREHKAEKQKREEHEIVTDRQLQQLHASEQEKQDDEERLRDWQASTEYRRAIETLSSDVDDARKATAWARERAELQQRQAHEALEKAQREALTIDDGRRVYFTRDGSRLYGEDDRQITNTGTIAEAQRQRVTKPDATTYEEYTASTKANREAAEQADQLRNTATRLDELDKRIKKGNLSPEDLAQARRDKQDIIDGMPPEARAEYTRLQGARQENQNLAYRSADPAFTAAPDLKNNFRQAVVGPPTGQGSQPTAEPRAPAYIAAPDY